MWDKVFSEEEERQDLGFLSLTGLRIYLNFPGLVGNNFSQCVIIPYSGFMEKLFPLVSLVKKMRATRKSSSIPQKIASPVRTVQQKSDLLNGE